MPDKPGPGQEKLQDFHRELAQLLAKQLEAQPELDDVRLKLLELHFEQQQPVPFLRVARVWHRRLKNPAASREWQRVASMGRMLMPGESLFSGKDSDRIEFIGETPPASRPAPEKFRRFGDEERFRPQFEAQARAYEPIRQDPKFVAEHELLLVSLANRRPTPLMHASRLSQENGGAQIYLKREDLAGEAPQLTVALTGQALLARRLGRQTLTIGTSDGRRGVLGTAVAAHLGLKLVAYMDAEQAQRQNVNVLFMRLMGAEVHLVKAGDYRNRDVREAALEHWHRNPDNSFMLTGLDAAPAPYPLMTQEFVAAIGRETRRQFFSLARRMPDVITTRGSQSADALALFPAFLAHDPTRLVCVEAEAAPVRDPRHDDLFNQTGMMSVGERKVAKNILDKLEYPSVAREHALFRASGRVEYVQALRKDAREALMALARHEGLVPAVDTAHVLAWAMAAARALAPSQAVLVTIAEPIGKDPWDISLLAGET